MSNNETSTQGTETDHSEIWLEPRPGDPTTGRQWCEDDVWSCNLDYAADGPPTRYIRADLYDALADKYEAFLNRLGATDA